METIFETNRQILAQRAVTAFFETVSSLDTKLPAITVGLSGGSSLLEFYGTVAPRIRELPESVRKKLRFALLDERLVASNHPDSNFKLLSERFVAPLRKRDPHAAYPLFRLRAELPDSATAYAEEVGRIDIALFGAGPDGHIASLFPNHPGLADESGNFIRVSDSPKPPSDRVSVSVPFVRTFPAAFAFFIGDSKAAAYRNFRNPDVPAETCPAKYAAECGKCTVVTDIGT